MDSDNKALRESEYRYRNLFQAMAASFWELDFSGVGAMLRGLKAAGVKDYAAHFERHPDFVREMMRATRVLDVNDQTVVLFGKGDKQALLTTAERFWPDASNAVFAASVIAAVTGKANYAAETKLRRLDGSELDALFTACFPPDSVAKGVLLIGVIDITERKQANERLARLQADFAHAARVSMLGELTASIAHEVNQPLAAIATNASAGLRWLNRAEPDLAEVRALTANIVADARRAGDIIARVRGMAAHREPDRARLSLNDVIGEALQFLHHELQAQGARVTLDLASPSPLVAGDRTQLQQVVVNLVINAAQAGAQPRRIRIATRAVAPSSVEVSVSDKGPGIAPEHLGRLFQSFFSTKASGMGMGLAISRSIVEAHGGCISAANNSDDGATFSFTLPAAT
jgi:PAS domain S-box-containing protein